MLYDVFDETVFDEIFGTSTYYPVLQQALFHCAAWSDIQNFFLAWAPANMGVLRTVVGDAYLMYLVYNAYPTFFTSQVMDNLGAEEFYRAFERMANFNISDLMALLQNSMEPERYNDFAASVPSFLTYEEKISLSEQYIYGSQRLGTKRGAKQLQSHTLRYESGNWLPEEVNILAEPVPAYVAQAGGLVDVGYGLGTWLANGKLKYPQEATYTRKVGLKEYELSNHLGNVQATILDRRLGIKTNPSDTTFSYVEADVKTAQDYYPFGMLMPGRNYTASSTLSYRYGYNGHEKDDEVYGKGNYLSWGDYGYDPRLCRRWNIDPQWQRLPGQSPYSANNNSPIQYTDPDGKFGILGAAIGAGVGAVKEIGTQVGSSLARGEGFKSAIKKIDWFDVGVSTVEGAVIGGLGPGAALLGTTISNPITSTLKASVDGKEGNLTYIFGEGRHKKDAKEFGIDLGSNLLGGSWGKLGMIAKSKVTGTIVETLIQTGVDAGIRASTGDHQYKQNPESPASGKQGGGWIKVSDTNPDGTVKDGAIIRAGEPLREVTITSNDNN